MLAGFDPRSSQSRVLVSGSCTRRPLQVRRARPLRPCRRRRSRRDGPAVRNPADRSNRPPGRGRRGHPGGGVLPARAISSSDRHRSVRSPLRGSRNPGWVLTLPVGSALSIGGRSCRRSRHRRHRRRRRLRHLPLGCRWKSSRTWRADPSSARRKKTTSSRPRRFERLLPRDRPGGPPRRPRAAGSSSFRQLVAFAAQHVPVAVSRVGARRGDDLIASVTIQVDERHPHSADGGATDRPCPFEVKIGQVRNGERGSYRADPGADRRRRAAP